MSSDDACRIVWSMVPIQIFGSHIVKYAPCIFNPNTYSIVFMILGSATFNFAGYFREQIVNYKPMHVKHSEEATY